MTAKWSETYDIAAREREVIGEPPRIEPAEASDLDEEAMDIILKLRASSGAGDMKDVPDFMRTMIKHKDVFRCQMQTGTAMFNGRIPPRERELTILRIGWLCGAPYEYGQHVVIAKRHGITSEEIAMVREGSGAAGWSDHERAILKGVEELLDNKAMSDATWNTLAETWNEALMIEYTMVVGQYVSTALVQNAIRVRMENDIPGLTNT
jgi:4-carboxymuconolactone decarboxylase